jgi:hypothetical protein
MNRLATLLQGDARYAQLAALDVRQCTMDIGTVVRLFAALPPSLTSLRASLALDVKVILTPPCIFH